MHILYFHQHFTTPQGASGTRSYEMARALVKRGHEVTMVCGTYGTGTTGLTQKPVKGIRTGDVDGIHVLEICLPYSNHDNFFKRSITFLRFALKSIKIACRTKYDLLFATSTPLTAGIPGIVMRMLKPKKPFIFEVRDLWPELPREMGVITNPLILWGMSILEWLSYNSASACIGLSPGVVEGIKRRCSKNKPVEMIPNGCDLELFGTTGRQDGGTPSANLACPVKQPEGITVEDSGFTGESLNSEVNNEQRTGQEDCGTTKNEYPSAQRPETRDRKSEPQQHTTSNQQPTTNNEVRETWNVERLNDHDPSTQNPESTPFRAVFTGAHGIANGLDAVLDAAAVLKERGRDDIELVFIGDGKLKPQLVERAKQENLTNCTFLDPIPKTELADEFKYFDVGMMILDNVPAFYYGTSPNKFFDYIAAGLPVLNNYPGWLADMIQEHNSGIAVPPDNPQAFADALQKMADQPEERRQMAANALKLAENHFDRKKLATQFAQFLEKQQREEAEF